MARILITGASGCIGHYIVAALIRQTEHDLFLLVRNPAKLKVNVDHRPGVHVIQGDLLHIEQQAELLSTIDVAILTAAAWGDPQETQAVNVTQTLALLKLLDVERCRQVIYFSTASILDQQNHLLEEAGTIGTDYIRTKYECHRELRKLAIAAKTTVVFPTLVFGGDTQKPMSHLSAGLRDVTRWTGLIRFFSIDGSFHYIHARDIAQVIVYLVRNPIAPGSMRQMVLGNPQITVNGAIREMCRYFRLPVPAVQLPLLAFAKVIVPLFRIQMAEWDWFCLQYRHFTYDNPVNPETFNIPPYCETVSDLMRIHGIERR
ncbi:MAG: NAD-dependent epimerase/dehydratase family protein [Elainellaceae cyanobacterium]